MVELTIPWEEEVEAAHERKKERYSMKNCQVAPGWRPCSLYNGAAGGATGRNAKQVDSSVLTDSTAEFVLICMTVPKNNPRFLLFFDLNLGADQKNLWSL